MPAFWTLAFASMPVRSMRTVLRRPGLLHPEVDAGGEPRRHYGVVGRQRPHSHVRVQDAKMMVSMRLPARRFLTVDGA